METIKEAIKHYGPVNQIIVAIEELSELQKELTKYLRGIGDVQHIIEELEDVHIMYEQLKIIFEVSEEQLDKYGKAKLKRLRQRIRDGTL